MGINANLHRHNKGLCQRQTCEQQRRTQDAESERGVESADVIRFHVNVAEQQHGGLELLVARGPAAGNQTMRLKTWKDGNQTMRLKNLERDFISLELSY